MAESGENTGPEPAETGESNDNTVTSDVISEEKLKEYRNAFAVFDKDGSNSITAEELKQVLLSLGKNPTDEEVKTMIAGVDDDGNGEIEFDEFIKLMEDEEKAFNTEDLMRQAFGVLDPNSVGYITVSRLKQVVAELGCEFTDEEIDEMMSEADTDGNGNVNYKGLIGLMSTEDVTLATAYKKREKIEEIKREEVAREEAERVEKEESERKIESERDDNGDACGIDEHVEIPDMEEIASQFDNEQYDKFSRQIPIGGRVFKRPGKKLPMSTTRFRYLQRRNKSLSSEGSNGEGIYGSMISLNEQESIRSGQQQEFRTHFKPNGDNWLGTIQDESQMFEAKFTSNQPRQYRHIESRLLDPKYYLKKSKVTIDEQSRFESANMRAICINFGNQPKSHREMNSKPAKSTTTVSASNVSEISQPKATTQSYAERAERERQSQETRLYYAIWRSAFTRAIERLRGNKEMKAVRLSTPELLKESAIKEEKERERRKNRPKQVHRLSVISPLLQTSSQNTVKDSSSPRAGYGSNRRLNTERLKRINSLEDSILEKQEEQKRKPSISPRKPRLAPLQKRGEVITRSGLNRIMKISV